MSEHKVQIERLTAAIEAKHQERASVESTLERIEAVATHGDALQGELDALRTQRRAAAAQALLEQRDADLREFDTAITKLEKSSAAVRSNADAAPVAIEQLRDQLAAIDEALAELVQRRRAAARLWLDERYSILEGSYARALDALGKVLCELAALEQLRDSALLAVDGAGYVHAPARQHLQQLYESSPLLTPHRFSWLTDETFWGWDGAPRVEESTWSRPRWLPMPQRAQHPAAAAEHALRDELRALGIDPDWRPARPAPAIVDPHRVERAQTPAGVTIQTIGVVPATIASR